MSLFDSLFSLFKSKPSISFKFPITSTGYIVPLEIPEEIQKIGWSKRIEDCHDKIQDSFPKVIAELSFLYPGYGLKVDYTWRSPQCQFELYKQGREFKNNQWVVVNESAKVTDKDGFILKSHHNVFKSQAADIYLTLNGKILWGDPKKEEEVKMYKVLGTLWEKHGLISGATWKFKWKDFPHTQVAYELV